MINSNDPFGLVYAPQVKAHLQAIDRKYYSLIRQTIEAQLQFSPDVETRNRKPLKRPVEFGADWEIRFGPNNRFRVFYAVEREDRRVVILAIGTKQRDRLMIGKEEISL